MLLSALAAGCGPATVPAKPRPAVPADSRPVPASPAAASPIMLTIEQLKVDPAKSVRIRGAISSILAVHQVPAKVVFKISDSTETITVVINKQVQLEKGTQIELVGRYKQLPSPTYKGPGEPPREAVFEVERFAGQP